MNSITITGNVTRDPELKQLNGGNATVKIGVAVNRRWQKNGEWQEQTSYFDVTAYGSLAENVANSIARGTGVIVTGRLEQRSWDDKKTGEKRTAIEIVADSIGVDLTRQVASVQRTGRSAQDTLASAGFIPEPF